MNKSRTMLIGNMVPTEKHTPIHFQAAKQKITDYNISSINTESMITLLLIGLGVS